VLDGTDRPKVPYAQDPEQEGENLNGNEKQKQDPADGRSAG
jgi:hypothetical protein